MANIINTGGGGGSIGLRDLFENATRQMQFNQARQDDAAKAKWQNVIETARVYASKDPRKAATFLQGVYTQDPEGFKQHMGFDPGAAQVPDSPQDQFNDKQSQAGSAALDDPNLGRAYGGLIATDSKADAGMQRAMIGNSLGGRQGTQDVLNLEDGAVMKAYEKAQADEKNRHNIAGETETHGYHQGTLKINEDKAKAYIGTQGTIQGLNSEKITNTRQERDPNSPLTETKIKIKGSEAKDAKDNSYDAAKTIFNKAADALKEAQKEASKAKSPAAQSIANQSVIAAQRNYRTAHENFLAAARGGNAQAGATGKPGVVPNQRLLEIAKGLQKPKGK